MSGYLGVGRATDLKNHWDRRIYRVLEMMPGFLAWGTLLLITVLSFFIPSWMAVFVIAFDVYWLTKTIFLTAHMNVTFRTMRKNMKRDWRAELENVESSAPELKGFTWKDIYHIVILPFATEPLSIVREGLAGLARSNFPLDKLIVVLAREERVKDSERIARAVYEEFGDKFFKFIITSHPDGLEGETVGKGSNEAWAGHKVKEEIIDSLSIPYERLVVSVFDIDTQVGEDYFGRLTYVFLTVKNRGRASYQPIPIFTNNIYQAPVLARAVSFSSSFWRTVFANFNTLSLMARIPICTGESQNGRAPA